MVTQKQIFDGVVKFIENDMMKSAGNGASKFIAVLGKNAIKKNPAIIEGVLENPMIKPMIAAEDGKYNIEAAADIIKSTMNEAGSLPIRLPRIPLILPDGDEIRLSREDIDKILFYMKEDEMHEKEIAGGVNA